MWDTRWADTFLGLTVMKQKGEKSTRSQLFPREMKEEIPARAEHGSGEKPGWRQKERDYFWWWRMMAIVDKDKIYRYSLCMCNPVDVLLFHSILLFWSSINMPFYFSWILTQHSFLPTKQINCQKSLMQGSSTYQYMKDFNLVNLQKRGKHL